MTNLQQERDELVQADRHLAEGERRIGEQIDLIQWMTKHGYDTVVAKDLLRLLEETLTIWKEHRQLILDAIARHERSEAERPKDPVPRPKAS
ncbi:hypothetical protein [Microvirga lotononidis]|uniref:Uncharacterized protein n=1 Tax=Microvirga lotononidis TaxID=864069 RepID=I4YPP9_9HYPH|nr:hypothetical protein [Microvirga lotononidis]EIM25941.1 hypothetical protein MicloDRAFT_00066700 [Microvirga lotononidis]WQO25854.1 hypothetical protein U0023_14165 [Microvirga lotononidis]